MASGREVLRRDDVLVGVSEMLPDVQGDVPRRHRTRHRAPSHRLSGVERDTRRNTLRRRQYRAERGRTPHRTRGRRRRRSARPRRFARALPARQRGAAIRPRRSARATPRHSPPVPRFASNPVRATVRWCRWAAPARCTEPDPARPGRGPDDEPEVAPATPTVRPRRVPDRLADTDMLIEATEDRCGGPGLAGNEAVFGGRQGAARVDGAGRTRATARPTP